MSNDFNIYERMHKIMKDVSYVQKEDKKVNNQYKFVAHDAVTAKIRPALLEHGVMAIPSYFDISVDGNRTNCSISMTFVNVDCPTDFFTIPCAGFGQGIDPQDKGAGKAMSYAYKYALLKVFALETGDDPEKDNIDHDSQAQIDERKAEIDALYKKIFDCLNANRNIGKVAFLSWWNAAESKADRATLKSMCVKSYDDITSHKDTALLMFSGEIK